MSRQFIGRALLVTTAAMLLTPAPAFAKGTHGSTTSAASCSGTSSGQSYGVTGINLPASTMVQFLVTDSSGGETSTTAMTSSTGTATVYGQVYATGTDNVTITDTSSRWNTLATCSFQAS